MLSTGLVCLDSVGQHLDNIRGGIGLTEAGLQTLDNFADFDDEE